MSVRFEVKITEAGVTFDNSFFDNYFDLVQQLKNGSFLGPVLYMSLVELRINQTKTAQHLSSTNVNFDQENFVVLF